MTQLDETTISEYVNSARLDSMRVDSFYLQEFNTLTLEDKNNAMIINSECILDKYQKIIDEFKINREFTIEEFALYKYNPKALSYELYGTTELWFLVLRANNMYSAIEFTKNPCYIYTGDILNTLNEIINIESDIMGLNDDTITNSSKNFTLTNAD